MIIILQPSGLPCPLRIDAGRGQPPQMTAALARIDEVNGLVTTREPVADEGKQHPIGFFFAVEEGACITILAKLRSSKPDGLNPFIRHRVARSS